MKLSGELRNLRRMSPCASCTEKVSVGNLVGTYKEMRFHPVRVCRPRELNKKSPLIVCSLDNSEISTLKKNGIQCWYWQWSFLYCLTYFFCIVFQVFCIALHNSLSYIDKIKVIFFADLWISSINWKNLIVKLLNNQCQWWTWLISWFSHWTSSFNISFVVLDTFHKEVCYDKIHLHQPHQQEDHSQGAEGPVAGGPGENWLPQLDRNHTIWQLNSMVTRGE